MSITAKCLIEAKFASNAGASEYLVPVGKHIIIDKFTAGNPTGSSVDISIWIVPSGGSSGNSNFLVKKTVTTLATEDLSEMQNQILNPGDSIFVLASTGSALSIRASGREVT